MKVCVLTGSFPPDVCGVGDYTYRLCSGLKELGVQVGVRLEPRLGVRRSGVVAAALDARKHAITHLQYPTKAFGARIGPQLLGLLRPMVVTAHELSQVHPARTLATFLLFARAQLTIFTTAGERDFALSIMPSLANRSVIIPIGSNIDAVRSSVRDIKDVVYFGLIRPRKGVEQVIELAHLIKGTGRHVRIIGSVDRSSEGYYESIRRKARDLPITWNIGGGMSEVAKTLSRSSVAYLPSPDGASERRGSLLALLESGVIPLTSFGCQTSAELKTCVMECKTPADVVPLLYRLEKPDGEMSVLRHNGRVFTQRRSWQVIARKHKECYDRILANEACEI